MTLQATVRGRAINETAIKVARTDGTVMVQVPYRQVYLLGLDGALERLAAASARPEEYQRAEVAVDLTGAVQRSCSCGLVWWHPEGERIVCPRCRTELEEA